MFNKNRKIYFTNQMYKEMCPLIEIPTYSEKDIDAEYSELNSKYKEYKKQLMLKKLFYYSAFFIVQILSNIVIFKLFENLSLENKLLQNKENIFLYFNAFAIFMSALIVEMYVVTTNLKPSKPALDKAEFSLRMKLTQPQLKNASHEKVQQIWMYCNSALTKPIKIKV